MPAPTKYPDWATDGTNVVEPPAGKKAAGWVPAEQPPSGWFNWWQGIVGQWTRWFDTSVNDLLSRVTAIEPVAADAARKSLANTFAEDNTFAKTLTAQTLASSGDVDAGGDVQASMDINAGRDFNYNPRPTRTTVVPYQLADRTASVTLTLVPGSLTLPPNSRVESPIRLPAGAVLTNVKVNVGTTGTANWSLGVSKEKPDFVSGAFGSSPIGSGATGTVTSGTTPDVASYNPGSVTIVEDTAYWVEVANSGSSTADMTVSAVQLTWVDPGPRNH